MNYAPIALFTYNRPDHTQQAVESLLTNAEAKNSDLYIFSDGPKNDKAVEGVKANREYIRSLKAANDDVNSPSLNREGRKGAFHSVTIIEREKNWGLANSLIAGITEVVNKYGKVIVVEDDLILSPYFLQFMNEGLDKYENEDKVGAISAYVPTSEKKLPETFFLLYFHSWGWATWKRSWALLELDSRILLRKLRFKKKKFDVGGSAGAYGNLYCQKVGLVDSWWVRLYASFFLANKLTLFPHHSLVTNNGQDGTGTHVGRTANKDTMIHYISKPVIVKDITVMESESAYAVFKKEFDSRLVTDNSLGKYIKKAKSFIRRLLYIDCM